MKKRGSLIVVSGPSGAGKGTLCKRLLELNPNVSLSVSATTRAMREGEEDGVHYYFISTEDFVSMIEKGELIEYSHHFENYYGTPKGRVLEQLEAGRDVILEIDVNGGAQVKEDYPEAILVFIAPPSLIELKKRIEARGTESEEKIKIRMHRVWTELEQMMKYDYIIVNEEVEEASLELDAVVRTGSLRSGLHEDFLKALKSEIKELI